jgi:diguanylate cyclase (GGDEF)-like protein
MDAFSSTPYRRSVRPARIVALACVALGLAGSAEWLGQLSSTALTLVSLLTIGAMVVGIRRLPRSTRLPWILNLSAIVLFLIGAGLRDAYQTLGDISARRSLIPDVPSAPAYLLLAVGLMLAVRLRRRGAGGALDAVLDSILAGLAGLALSWVFLITPALAKGSASVGVRLSLVIYPPLSIICLVVTAQLAFAGGRRIASLNAAVGAMACLLLGDALFTLVDARVLDLPHGIITFPYMVAHAGICYLTLHPSFPETVEPVRVEETTPTPARLAFVAIALAIPAVVSVTLQREALSDRIVLALIVLSLTAVATWRVTRALQHHARSERRLRYQATHDSLTGTLNRHGLLNELGHWPSDRGGVAMFFLDLDRFKLVNDTFGHSFGDELLLRVTERLRAGHGDTSLLARIGGDEFIVVVPGILDLADAVARGEDMRAEFGRPFEVRGSEIPVSVSVGIALATSHPDAEALLRDSDTAMYSAKEAGRDAVVVFDDSMRDRVAHRLELERDLRHALDRGELTVYYQPVVHLPSGEVTGFEALIRWHHPTRGTVSPLAFIPIAEETGLITQIGAWVLDEACRQLRVWRNLLPNGEHLTMAVNISARQLGDSDLPFMIDRTLWRHRLDGSAVCLELTESMLLDNPDAAAAVLVKLRERGLHLAIDDFGTGYSSLAYLRRFPFDRVKIDRAFVEPLDQPESGEHQLVSAIVAMADALGMSTVAEGVETIEQADQLVAMGCATAQGFYYSRPVPADAVPATVQRLGIVRRSTDDRLVGA